MADFRQIHTKIWKDGWFLDLEPSEKLLWIYLFSNDRATIAGIYEIPLKVIVFETGLDKQYCIDTLSIFYQQGKILYQDGIMWVFNLRKYHETQSPKIQTRIKSDFDAVPEGEVKNAYAQAYGIDTLSIPYLESESHTTLHYTKQNKTKQDNTKQDNTKQPQTPVSGGGRDFGEAVRFYEDNIAIITPAVSSELMEAVDHYPEGWVVEAMNIATQANKRSWRYIKGVLRNWEQKGYMDTAPRPTVNGQPVPQKKTPEQIMAEMLGSMKVFDEKD